VARQKATEKRDLFEDKPSKSADILEFLSPAGVHIDELLRESGLDSSELSLKLLELELSGQIERQPGNVISLVRKK
jgi:DNA processing protein